VILSFEHRFVFVKGRKVAGTSVEIALSQLCGPGDIVTPIMVPDERLRYAARNYSDDPDAERRWLEGLRPGAQPAPPPTPRFYNHMPLAEVAARVDLTGFEILAVERSPYAKVLSFVNWRRSAHRYTGGRLKSRRRQIAAAFDTLPILEARNIDLYRGADGAIAVQPWRFEDVHHEVAALADRLGRPRPHHPHVKRGLDSDRLDPCEWFAPAQLDLIERDFAEEFDAFGYPRLARHARARAGGE
jgi:hypothetical protein